MAIWSGSSCRRFNVEVCLVIASIGPNLKSLAESGLLESLRTDSGPRKRLSSPLLGSNTASAVSPSHSIRVPMHLNQVPRG